MKQSRKHNQKWSRCSVRTSLNQHKSGLTASGRIRSVRALSSKLMFLDIERDTQRLQIMVELKKLTALDGLDESFKSFKKVARLGDWICK
jgi:lysyl-tRNA synthetase class II